MIITTKCLDKSLHQYLSNSSKKFKRRECFQIHFRKSTSPKPEISQKRKQKDNIPNKKVCKNPHKIVESWTEHHI
jgi:hypothetical protein